MTKKNDTNTILGKFKYIAFFIGIACQFFVIRCNAYLIFEISVALVCIAFLLVIVEAIFLRKKIKNSVTYTLFILVLITFFIFLPGTKKVVRLALQKRCHNNMILIKSCLDDYVCQNGKLPVPKHWCDILIADYGTITKQTFHCPFGTLRSCSYALNEAIYEQPYSHLSGDIVVIFEISGQLNTIGGKESLNFTNHNCSARIIKMDNTTIAVKQDEIKGLKWK